MVRIVKYSKETLFSYLNRFKNNIYLLFLDLDKKCFDNTVCVLKSILNIDEARTFEDHNESYLIVFGSLNFQRIQEFITKLDSMDIGEFEISEYHNIEKVMVSKSLHDSMDLEDSRSIYVNKDEKIVQIYNIT